MMPQCRYENRNYVQDMRTGALARTAHGEDRFMTTLAGKGETTGDQGAADPSRTLRILLVDSHTATRTDNAAALRAKGHAVLTVDSGSAALGSLQQFPFDLVVTELLMPEMDGLELIIRIRNARHPVSILAVCDVDRPFNRVLLRHARTFGADATLARHGPPGQLADAVGRMTAGGQS